MLFNSLAFLVFLPVVFAAYWGAQNNLRLQNLLVLVASYVFYGWWDWRFLLLIALSTLIDYSVGRSLESATRVPVRRALLGVSIVGNLGMLGIFKYFNFFAASFADVLGAVGLQASPVTLNIVLPVGISFYTFQTLSYTIDVYRRQLEPTRDFAAFATYVAFFPQLVAGPIERATQLLPQFEKPRRFDEGEAVDGLRQMLWGFFKKVAVADSCGILADEIFSAHTSYSAVTLWLGAFFFAVQIYGDFSGYSDIAIGTARLFGFKLMRNFAYPYFSRDIAEFWRRWHISLSTWFRDYVYIPLGGSRGGQGRAIRNVFVIFVVSGIWHGANWTFAVWGLLNALYFLPLFVGGKNRNHVGTVAEGRVLPSPRELWSMLVTFVLTLIAWVFFRAASVGVAIDYLVHMFSRPWIEPLRFSTEALIVAFLALAWEWVQREREHGMEVSWLSPPLRRTLYVALVMAILSFAGEQRDFIYFQF